MIEVTNLTKKYGDHTAISNLSFSIEDGHVYGFLGPNGAGKSTTMNMMTGCLAATSGEIKIDGYDIFESPVEAKRKIGYLPEQPPLYQDMTPYEYLTFVAEAKNVPKPEVKEQVTQAMHKTQIIDVKDRLIKNLSKGYKQRVGIAQALIGNPSTIILDEPTVGLDPNQIIEIRSLITELGHTHTIILSSHILSEVQAVCDRIMIITKGEMVANDTPENLEVLFAGTAQLKLTIKGDVDTVTKTLNQVDGVTGTSCKAVGNTTEAVVDFVPNQEVPEKVFFAFADIRMPILAMCVERASLEDIFIELTKTDEKIQETHNLESDEKEISVDTADIENRESEGK